MDILRYREESRISAKPPTHVPAWASSVLIVKCIARAVGVIAGGRGGPLAAKDGRGAFNSSVWQTRSSLFMLLLALDYKAIDTWAFA